MSEKLTFSGSLLAANAADRTLKGLLLPYGEEGRTNRGRVTASAGAIKVPTDVSSVVLNLGHDRDRPAGRATSITETAKGLVAEFHIAHVPAGDQLLAESAEGLRQGLSVELDDIVIRSGQLVAGSLSEVGAVVRPAFPSALVAAEDAGEDPEDDEDDEDETDDDEQTDDETDPTQTEDEQSDEQKETIVTARAAAPQDLKASAAKRGGGLKAEQGPQTPQDLFKLLAQAYNTQDSTLMAALSDVIVGTSANGIYGRTSTPQWLGELWSGRAYQRKYVPLMSTAPLTNMKVAGWRFVDKPVMADYAGDKAAVGSNAVTVEAANAMAQRLAGAWDIDRAYFDFGDSGFIESFIRALTESYAKLSDGKAVAALVTAATANATTAGTVPASVNPAMAAIVDGALAILDQGTPSFALVGSGLYRDVLLTRNDDTLAYLNASLGLEDGTMANFRILPAPSSVLASDSVVVGAREAVTFYELGQTPIRVEAENIANGGRDIGVFGYYASVVNDAKAITLVDTNPGA